MCSHQRTKVCGPIVGTSDSTCNFGHCIGSEMVSFDSLLQTMQIVILSFAIEVEMQSLSKVKVNDPTSLQMITF